MRIEGNVQPVSSIYTNDKKISGIENIDKATEVKDNVKISDKGRYFAVAQKALKDIPDIRQDKVNEISAKLKNSSYSVKGEDIVDKIFGSKVDLEG